MSSYIEKELLDIIVCPECRSSLRLSKKSSILRCSKCGLKYTIEEGIPNLMFNTL